MDCFQNTEKSQKTPNKITHLLYLFFLLLGSPDGHRIPRSKIQDLMWRSNSKLNARKTIAICIWQNCKFGKINKLFRCVTLKNGRKLESFGNANVATPRCISGGAPSLSFVSRWSKHSGNSRFEVDCGL